MFFLLLALSVSTTFAAVPGPPHEDPNFEIDVAPPGANAMDAIDSWPEDADDWETVYKCYEGGDGYGDGSACAALHDGLNSNLINTTGIMHDHPGQTIFWKGGSKDIHDVSNWWWSSGGVPDKDEILHAYAAAYDVGGDLVIYIGADRYANDGDAMMGAWFFQEAISRTVTKEGQGQFDGVHRNGDILWIGHFSGGGVIAEMKVLKWNDSESPGPTDPECTNGDKIMPEQVKGSSLCLIADGPYGDHYFASVNTDWVESPWDYTPKQPGSPPYDSGWFPYNSFMEGGLNITALLGGNTPCYSSFMIESRSSTEYNAILKDFVLGRIDSCKIEVEKTCTPTLDVSGAYINSEFAITVHNTGHADLDYVDLADDQNPSNPWTYSGLIPSGGSVEVARYNVQETFQPLSNTVTAVGGTTGGYVTAPATDTVVCEPVPVPAGLEVHKYCDEVELVPDGNSRLWLHVSYTGEICNTGEVRLVNVAATDEREGQVYPVALSKTALAPDECASYIGSYYPSMGGGVTAYYSQTSECFMDTEAEPKGWSDVVNASADSVFGELGIIGLGEAVNCLLCPTCAAPPPPP